MADWAEHRGASGEPRPMAKFTGAPVARLLVALSLVLTASEAEEPPPTGKAADNGKAAPEKLEPAKAEDARMTLPSAELPPFQLTPVTANFWGRYTRAIELPVEAPKGLQVGHTTLYPSFSETLTYDDNLFGLSSAKIRDFILRTEPGFGINHRFSENVALTTGYAFSWNDYLDDNARDYLTHSANFNLNVANMAVEGLSLSIYDSYGQTANTGILNENFLSYQRQHQNTVGTVLSFSRGPITTSGSYSFSFVDLFGVDNADYSYHTVQGLFAYKVDSHFSPFLRYSFQSYDFALDQSNYTDHTIAGGLRYRPLEQFMFELALGNHRAVAVATGDSTDGPLAGLRLVYVHNERISAYFTASREYEVGVRTGGGTTISLEAGTQARVLKDLWLGSRASWTREVRQGGSDLRTTQAGVVVRYNFRRQFVFTGDYSFTCRESNYGHYVSYNKAVLGFSWRF